MTEKPNYWNEACALLSIKDPTLKMLISRFEKSILQSRGNAFETLVRSVVGQQISTAAAEKIWQKMRRNFPINHTALVKIPSEKLRTVGLSTQKAEYIRNIATHFCEHRINDKNYWRRNYQDIHRELLGIRGVGAWTVQMFAIFYLMESDIFPRTDLGLIKAIRNLYHIENMDEIDALAKTWQPFRTVATWYLWRSIDAEIVCY